ncbi:SDR family oxidoreductase [Pleionea sp. CnH1-48]|uniref:SDR family oxidoreductase n=1 Tax=Pleionea sp. CnH1-48 TaxID=2954494 RepID=UPI002096E892|nr:SDR family oxidoreductase [Pleionea sp. CnH1-48]MCO7227287.1 SDR family oxidoreductase [Pleionea sp. CnH1-48]
MSYQSIFKTDTFRQKNIIVTGGGSGIGRCTAHELAALGAHVILIGRNEEKLQRVCQEIQDDNGSASYHSLDIRKEDDVAKAISQILFDFKSIHGLVNNAGGQFPSPLKDISQKGFEAVVNTNLVGGFLVAREVVNQYMQQHGGAIVNIIADMWGGMPMMGHSGAARSGMENLTRTAAVEWAQYGVRVNAVAPGWILSSGLDTYDERFQKQLKYCEKAVPLKRLGRESEVSSTITFLLSDAAAFVSGATLKVDGAASLGNQAIYPLPDHDNSKPFAAFHREKLPDIFR